MALFWAFMCFALDVKEWNSDCKLSICRHCPWLCKKIFRWADHEENLWSFKERLHRVKMSLKIEACYDFFLNLIDAWIKGITHKKEVIKLVWIRFQRRGLCWSFKALDFSPQPESVNSNLTQGSGKVWSAMWRAFCKSFGIIFSICGLCWSSAWEEMACSHQHGMLGDPAELQPLFYLCTFWLSLLLRVGECRSAAPVRLWVLKEDCQSCPSASFQYPLGFINSLLAGSLQHRDY